jgi:hypothetical protein
MAAILPTALIAMIPMAFVGMAKNLLDRIWVKKGWMQP